MDICCLLMADARRCLNASPFSGRSVAAKADEYIK
jgi:hypothetical protein